MTTENIDIFEPDMLDKGVEAYEELPITAQIAAGFTPAGLAADVATAAKYGRDAVRNLIEGRYGEAAAPAILTALAAVGLIPVIGDIAKKYGSRAVKKIPFKEENLYLGRAYQPGSGYTGQEVAGFNRNPNLSEEEQWRDVARRYLAAKEEGSNLTYVLPKETELQRSTGQTRLQIIPHKKGDEYFSFKDQPGRIHRENYETVEINPNVSPKVVPAGTKVKILEMREVTDIDGTTKSVPVQVGEYTHTPPPRDFFEGGDVDIFEPEPRRVRGSRATSPLPTPSLAQLAYFGSMFAPGAGYIDASGEMPAMPAGDVDLIDAFSGEKMPSLAENIEGGEYFDASMQGLGALGDTMYAVPVAGTFLGPTLGTLFKGASIGGKAIKRGIEALDPVVDANRAGFETNEIMYHGTSDTFSRFKPSKTGNLGEGVYSTPDPEMAGNRAIVSSVKPNRTAGANIMPVYIKRDLNYLDIDYDPRTKIDVSDLKAQGYDGVRRFEEGKLVETNIFDPDNVRPVFSIDGPPEPPKTRSKDELVENFKANQAPVGTIDPDTSKPVTESLNRSRAKRYTESLSKPAFRRREEARAAGEIQDLVSAERTILDPNDLYGYSLVPVAGDRSGIGALTDIRGVPLSFPVAVQGGPGYPLYMSGKGKGWASMQGAANQKQMNIIQAMDETGMAPLGVYTAMGREGINFSTPVVLSMVGQLDYLKIPKKQIAAFNSAVKKGTPANPGIKDFVGLNSPDLVSQLTGEMASSVSSGNIRKAVVEEMKKPRWQNLGFPVYEDVVEVVTDPALRIPRGPKGTLNPAETGYSIFEGVPSKPTFQDPYHLSYDTVIPGDYLGGLPGRGVPPEIMFPQNFARMAEKTNVAGKPLTRQQQLGSLAMEPMVEPVTDELIENLAQYLNRTEGTNFAQGGEVEDPRISRQIGFDENDEREVALMNAGIPFDYDRSGVLSLTV